MKLSFTHYILKSTYFLMFFVLVSTTYLSAASIGDWVWADANNNGILEGGEGGIGETTIELYDNSGTLIATTESNHDGYYTFSDLPAGTYTVSVVENTLVAPLTTPNSYTVTLAADEQYLTADFGQLTTFTTTNKPPVIITKNACTAPNTPVSVCLEVFEPENDNTTITEGTTQTGATFTILNADCFRYTPLPGYEGVDTVSVTVCDDANPIKCSIGKIAVSVPCPGGPLGVNDTVSTSQATPIIIEVLANDNGQAPLGVTNVEDAPNGTTQLINNVVLYTPNAGFIGTDSFTYSITDISNQTSSATVYVIVTEIPIDCELEMMECVEIDTPMVICPEYCEVEGSSLNVIEITSSAGGEMVGSTTEPGCYKYIPPTGFTGNDVVTILACNIEGNCAQTTISIQVLTSCDGGGDDIVAQDDFAVAIENTFVLLGVLGNDFDPQGDDFSLQSFEQPANGTVTQVGDLLRYEPNTNFVGIDSFTYTICDVNGNCDNATVTIEVIDNGQGCTDTAEVCDNATTPTEICIDFCDVNDAIITGLTSVFEATLSINSTTCFNYTPPSGFAGTDEVEVVGCNELGVCDTILVTVIVACPAPIANDDSGGAMVDEPLNLNVLENDAQTCDYTLSATLVGEAQMGEATLTSNGDLSYTPNEGATGQEVLTYVACNDCTESLCDTAIVTIVVGEQVNQAPIAVDDDGITVPNTPLDVFVLANDSDPDGDTFNITATTNPSNGTITINPATQVITYTPNTDFIGTDSFTYQICDDGEPVLCSTATVTITVDEIIIVENDPPVAVDDAIVTQMNMLIGIGVLGNDSDPNGDDLTITAISSPPSNGTAEIVGFNNSAINYTPNPNFIGTDVFEYVVCDTEGLCDTATVTVTVINPDGNAPPIAVDDNATTEINTPISIDVLENDIDANGDNLIVTSISSNPSNGTTVIEGNQVIYTPNTGFNGTDSFEYVVCDPDGLCDTALVTVNVMGEVGNQAPIAVDDEATTEINTPISIEVLANDNDPNGDNLTISDISSLPSNGTVTIEDDAAIYTPDTDFIGTDSFEYVVCDTEGLCDTALVVIEVVEEMENQAPIAVDDETTTEINTPISIEVLANDSDPDGDEIILTDITVAPQNGTAEFNLDSTVIVYSPNTDFIGTDSFEYVICDPEGLCDTALVVIEVVEEMENQAPIAVDDEATTTPNTPIEIPVLDNDSDPDGDDLILTTFTLQPSNGFVSVNENGDGIVYTPNEDFEGMDTLEYVICDPDGLCDTALVVITIAEPPFPIIADTTDEDTPLTVCVEEFLDTINFPIDSMVLFTLPSNGVVELDTESDSCFVYTPAEDFNGEDEFLLGICNMAEDVCDTITVNITVLPVNDAPTAVDDLSNTDVNTPIEIPVLDNDFDIDGDFLAVVTIEVAPSNGEATINPDGTVNYTPDSSFVGIDTFVYVITDPEGLTDTATVIIGIGEVIGIIAVDDEATTDIETPIDIPILDNDLFGDFPTDLTVITIVANPSNGIVTVNGDGVQDTSITYTPLPDFVGADTFEYVVCIAAELCDTATVIVTVNEIDTGCEIFIPNAFSPNQDGINDELMIPNLGACFIENELVIFNRWGDEVFRRQNYDDLDDPWDGTWQKNKENVPDGTYFYILTGTDEEGVALEPRSGFIEVCR